MINARIVLSRRLHHRKIHLHAFLWSGIGHTLYTTRWVLSKGIEAYSRVFTVDRVADDQREFTISRAVGMRFVPLFLFPTISHLPFRKYCRYRLCPAKTTGAIPRLE